MRHLSNGMQRDNSKGTGFGYTMAQDATITGTSTNGKVKYNSTFKKGWNIEAWKDVNGVSEYSVVGSLPADVVWF